MKQMRLSRYALLACLSLPTVTLHAAPTDSAATNTHTVAASAIPPTALQAAPKIAPTRVISAGSNVTEIIVALGAGDVLVGLIVAVVFLPTAKPQHWAISVNYRPKAC